MPNNHAYRGKEFEVRLNNFCQLINRAGGFAHKLQPEYSPHNEYPMIGEPFDYIITVPGEIHCFDAKSSEAKNWYFRVGTGYKNTYIRRELASLIRIKHSIPTAHCYFLIWFKPFDCIIRFDTDIITRIIDSERKSLIPNDGIIWHSHDLLVKCPGYDITRDIAGPDAYIPRSTHTDKTLSLFDTLKGGA